MQVPKLNLTSVAIAATFLHVAGMDFDPRLLATVDTSGEANGVVVTNGVAYVANGSAGLQIVNVSNPWNPIKRGTVATPGKATQLVFRDSVIYVADGAAGLQVIDVSNADLPRIIGSADTAGMAQDVVLQGNFAYVADGAGGLQIIDISSAANPRLTGILQRYTDSTGEHPMDATSVAVTVDGAHAFLADDQEDDLADANTTGRIHVIDIRDPAKPLLEAILPHQVGGLVAPLHLTLSSNILYVADTAMMQIFDAANPTNLTRIGLRDPGGQLSFVTLSSNLAFFGGPAGGGHYGGVQGLQIFDVTSPSDPNRLGLYRDQLDSPPTSCAVDGRFVFLTRGSGGLQIIDTQNPANPQRLGRADNKALWGDNKEAWSLIARGSFVYMANGAFGIAIFDATNPSAPVPKNTIPGWFSSVYPLQHGFCAVESTRDFPILHFYDVGDPAQPEQRATLQLPDISNIAINPGGDRLFVASPFPGKLQILDVSDLANPKVAGSCTNSGSAYGMAATDSFLYLTHGTAGIEIFDISNPSAPFSASKLNTPGSSEGICIVGSRAYVLNFELGLQIWDISAPLAPVKIGESNLAVGGWDVKAQGDLAYVANKVGVTVFDVKDPTRPRRVGANTSFPCSRIFLSDDRIYCAAIQYGLQILDEFRPLEIKLEQLAAFDAASFHFRVSGPEGYLGQIERSIDLQSWSRWKGVSFGADAIDFIDTATDFSPTAYYRVALP